MLFFVRRSRLDFSLNIFGFSSAAFGSPLREQSTYSEVVFGRDTFSYCFGQRFLCRGSFFNIRSGLVMQVIEESIDVKSMKPSLFTQGSVRTIAMAHDNREMMRSTWKRGCVYF